MPTWCCRLTRPILKVSFSLFAFFILIFEKCAIGERPVAFLGVQAEVEAAYKLSGVRYRYLSKSAHVGVLFDASAVIVLAVMAKLDKKNFPIPSAEDFSHFSLVRLSNARPRRGRRKLKCN